MQKLGLLCGLVTAGAVVAIPQSAEACACCGSDEYVQIVGWSKDGKGFVLEHVIDATCHYSEYFEVWKVGADAPEYCLSAFSEEANERMDCGDIEGTDPNMAVPDVKHELKLPAGFDAGATSIPASHLMVWKRQVYREDDAFLDVEILVHGDTGFAIIFHEEYEAYEDDALVPAVASVWPSPTGRNAVMLLRSERYDDETHASLDWVKLPRSFDRADAVSEPHWVEPREPPAPPDPDADNVTERARANRWLARARVYERLGDTAQALLHTETAASQDPSFMRPWIELARRLASFGQAGQALALLGRVDALPCKECREELRTALPNPSFDAVRDTPAFTRLGTKR